MSSGNDQLAKVVQEAAADGEITAPAGLIALIGGLENSLQALQSMDRANELFDALAIDRPDYMIVFNLVPATRGSGDSTQEEMPAGK